MPISACQHRMVTGYRRVYDAVQHKKNVSNIKPLKKSIDNSSGLIFSLSNADNTTVIPARSRVDTIKCRNVLEKMFFLLVFLNRVQYSISSPVTNNSDVNISRDTTYAPHQRVIVNDSFLSAWGKGNAPEGEHYLPEKALVFTPGIKTYGEGVSYFYEVENSEFNNKVLNSLTGYRNDNDEYMHASLFFLPQKKSETRSKRMSSQLGENKNLIYTVSDNIEECHVRTKNNQGTSLGDSLLLSGEYLRNPIRAAAEQVYKNGMGGNAMPEGLSLFTEAANVGYDVVFSFMTSAAYPIVKYGTVKLLRTAAHIINKDNDCLKNEFSPQELANLLFDTEIGITHRRPFFDHPFPQRPSEFEHVKRFLPNGVFVHENPNTGLNTVKYIKVNHDGAEYLIGEKHPGVYYTLHPGAVKPDFVERRVYFDADNNKIHFRQEMPSDQGIDYEVVDGKKFIKIHNENHEVYYDWDTKKIEVILRKLNGETLTVPVYMEPLSKTWHLSVQKEKEVFTQSERAIIHEISVGKNSDSSYLSEENYNPSVYGAGRVYREKNKGDIYGYTKQSVVEMNGSLVPVKEQVMPGKGVRYVVYDVKTPEGNNYPIEWDGRRWVFESPTSIRVSSNLKKIMMGRHNTDSVNANALSAPDSQGLQWSSKQSYLKINEQYIKLKKLNDNRFYINNDDGVSKIFLRFDGETLRVEDVSERLKNILSVGLSGRGGKVATAEEILLGIDGFTEESVRNILSRYAFPAQGQYSQQSFALDIEEYGVIPLWAERFSIARAEPVAGGSGINKKTLSASGSSSESSLSSVSSTPDDPVPRTNNYLQASALPPDSLINERGMIERKNFPKLYRVEKKRRVDRRGGPNRVIQRGFFTNSALFAGPRRMIDGDIVITSRTREGATLFGEREFEGRYYLYEIDAMGRRAVSLNENIECNPAFTELRENYDPGSIAELKASKQIETFAQHAYEFDEVHLDNTGDPMTIRLIKTENKE